MAHKQKRTRLPQASDVDDFGMVKMQVKNRRGDLVVRRVAAVDAREIILADAGSLDIDDEVQSTEDGKSITLGVLQECGLDELREFCTKMDLSYVGKPESVLRRMLVDNGFTFDEHDED